MIRVQAEIFDVTSELKAFEASGKGHGAFASFVGYVRDEERAVRALTLQHYPGFTESQIQKIETEAKTRFEVTKTLIIHRHGKMLPGEPIVLVAALANHRKPAFQAVDFLMDYLKTQAPFWKKEENSTGESWIEPKSGDYSAVESWKSNG